MRKHPYITILGILLLGTGPAGAVTIRGPVETVRTRSLSHRDTLYVPAAAVARAWGFYQAIEVEGGIKFFSSAHEMTILPGCAQVRLDGRSLTMDGPADWVEGALVVPIYLALIDLPSVLALPVPLEAEGGGKVRVMLDPGHGGKDPGALGAGGVREKDVVLDISRRVQRLLEARGFEVLMTRRDDTFIPLSRRAGMANRLRADIFVSIHANSAQNHLARGGETFYYSEAGDAHSEYLAALENAGQDLLDILLDGAAVEAVPDRESKSRQLAGKVQGRLSPLGASQDRGVKTARFHVIRHTAMPSILVETGFLSNGEELALLGSGEFKQKVAKALANGITDYFRYGYGRELVARPQEEMVMKQEVRQ